MREQLIATSILHPERQTILNVLETTPLNIGGGSEKQYLEAEIDGTNQKVSLIERNYDPMFVEGWQILRQAGIPVPQTLRLSSRKTLLVTDVKANGGEVYGRGLANQEITGWFDPTIKRQRPRPDIDQKFIKMCAWHSLYKIKKAALNYADHATQNGIYLPWDDPFELLVRPNGSWELITLDVRETCLRLDHEKDLLDLCNKDLVTKFLNCIQGLRKGLMQKVVDHPAA